MAARIAKKPARRVGGRPNAQAAEQLRGLILQTASDLFLGQGYGATSIDAVAKQAGISKRTFYHRFEDKADLFGAVVRQLVASLRPADTAVLFEGKSLAAILRRLAQVILEASLSPKALALQRLVIAEAARFPELAALLDANGARLEAIRRIADLLQQHRPSPRAAAEFAAEQFLQLVTATPQRRALGIGTPMTEKEREHWVRDTVDLFLTGYVGKSAPAKQ